MDAYVNDAHLYGVAVGIVSNINDPEGLGRVKTVLPWMTDTVETDWARVATPMAGPGRGIYFRPDVNDEVLVAFEHGNPDMPYVLGGLWNGKDQPPVADPDSTNDVRMIKSRAGSTIRFSDVEDDAQIHIVDSSGKNMIVIRASDNSITITADGDITLQAGQGKLTLSGDSVEITATSGVKIEASQAMEVEATGQLTLKGSVVNIN
ncbi:MAG: phage baseplate assembly protein V [Streptosporangiaceae bacterium]